MGDQTVVQMREIKKGVGAAGSVLERYLIRLLGPLGTRIAQASQAGRVMALIGVITVLVSLVLIFTNGSRFQSHEKKGHKYVTITYEQKGYGVAFLAGIGLFVVGVMQKKGK